MLGFLAWEVWKERNNVIFKVPLKPRCLLDAYMKVHKRINFHAPLSVLDYHCYQRELLILDTWIKDPKIAPFTSIPLILGLISPFVWSAPS